MAAIQKRQDSYRILFRYEGKQHAFTLGEVSEQEANTKASQVDYLLMRLKQHLAVLPPGIDIVEYVQLDGKIVPREGTTVAPKTPLATLKKSYLDTHEESLEANSLETSRIHFRHLEKILGKTFCISGLELPDLQRYVNRRAKAKGRNGRRLSVSTIQKELTTLRAAWNWGRKHKLVAGPFPNDGLVFPKTTEKPAFQTREEIERRIKAGGLDDAEVSELWDALYLQIDEIGECLKHVKANAKQPFLYPMVCFAAYTGARRSEILRTRILDVDLAGRFVTIHERKRVKGKLTTRRVPIAPILLATLQDWLAVHPGGQFLFAPEVVVARSKKRSLTTGHHSQKTRPTTAAERQATVKSRKAMASGQLTPNEAHDHLQRVLSSSPWDVLKGWHVFRHSFISACASRGIDQRLVESWAGHMSKEMSKRYAHLYPSTQHEALLRVFPQ